MKAKITKWVLIGSSAIFLFFMLIMPLLLLFVQAFGSGIESYLAAVTDKYAQKALVLTLEATVAAVVINTIFGLAAAWLITKYHFRGKKILTTLIDIPFAISPVIAGLVFSLTYGRLGWAHGILEFLHIKILFAVPGVILATVFVTFPFVSREILPVLNAQGTDEEEAAALMGAKPFYIFRKITLPHIKWPLLYGIILCTSRAMGEFGAVSVISGHLRGKTNTLPLHIEILYNDFKFHDAFAVSTLLVAIAVILLILRNIIEHKGKKGSEQ